MGLNPRYVSPLRYPGGKAKLAPVLQELVETNGLCDCDYVEPYAGGASAALSLLLGEYVAHIHINDIDPALHAFWRSVFSTPDELCEMILRRRVSRAEWRRQRAVYRDLSGSSSLELGFAAFFLNRTNRSGIICSGGMIGGNNQAGKWKIDARYNKEALVERIQRIARYKDRISTYRADAARLLPRLFKRLPPTTLYYLDPPYYVKGTRRLYANFYRHRDHVEIGHLVRGSGRNWVVSYDDQKEIREIYSGESVRKFSPQYSASRAHTGSEVIFFSPGLRVPDQPALTKGR